MGPEKFKSLPNVWQGAIRKSWKIVYFCHIKQFSNVFCHFQPQHVLKWDFKGENDGKNDEK